jgi:hypothetical protein
MSGGRACTCRSEVPSGRMKSFRRQTWKVIVREGNSSAFNGGRFQRTAWSLVRCSRCHLSWRTRAAYVQTLDDMREPVL